MFFSFLGFMACFLLVLNRCTEKDGAHRGKGAKPETGITTLGSMPPLSFQMQSFLKDSEEKIYQVTCEFVTGLKPA
jgi:hypothetical protein